MLKPRRITTRPLASVIQRPAWPSGRAGAAPAGAAAASASRVPARRRRMDRGYAEHHLSYVAKVVWFNTRRMVGLNGSAWIRFDAGGMPIPRWLLWACLASFWLLG